MNAAHIDKSQRLQRVLAVLSDYGWHGTREINRAADVCAVNSCICELRDPINGFRIESKCVGRGLYEYRLAPRAPVQLELAA